MPTISRAYIDQFSRQIDGLSASARQQLTERLEGVDDFDEVLAVMRDVCGPYTQMSAALAALFYNGIRDASGAPGSYKAEAISGYDEDAMSASALATMSEHVKGNGTATISSLMGDVADREINNASRECVRANCKRDPAKPRYASVPTGSNPCSWCVMRASAGFIYAADSGSHKNCHCRLVPGFNGSAKVEGYNQSAYEDEWYEAANAYRKGDISDELSERIKKAKEEHDKRFNDPNDDGVTKKWDSTNAVLMVMRDKRGK